VARPRPCEVRQEDAGNGPGRRVEGRRGKEEEGRGGKEEREGAPGGHGRRRRVEGGGARISFTKCPNPRRVGYIESTWAS
jgi:hypothetical protein